MTAPAKGRGGNTARPNTTRAFWLEHEIDRWIHDRIRGSASDEQTEEPAHPRLIAQKEVLRRTGLSRITVWRWEKRGVFPPRVHLSGEEV